MLYLSLRWAKDLCADTCVQVKELRKEAIKERKVNESKDLELLMSVSEAAVSWQTITLLDTCINDLKQAYTIFSESGYDVQLHA